jgi:hypothetical protein
MSTRKSIFALAALVTLSAAALAPTNASAFGFGGHFGGFGRHFGGFGHQFGERFGGYRFGGGFEHRFWYPRFSWRFEHRYRYPRFGWGYGHCNWGSSYGSGIHICPLVSGVYCPPLPRPFKPVIHMGMAVAPAAE